MTITVVGELSIGAAVPSLALSIGGLLSSINLVLPQIQAQIAGLQLSVPIPSIGASLQLAQQIVTGIGNAIALGVPGIDMQSLAIADLLGQLLAQLSVLNALLALANQFSGLLGHAGLYVYAFDGQVGQFGTELQAQLSSGFPGGNGIDHGFGLVLGTVDPAVWAALQLLFKTS